MTRSLIFFAVAGLLGIFVVPALSVAPPIPDWARPGTLWRVSQSPCGATTSNRAQVTLPFNPGDRLTIALPGSVRYGPADKAEAIVSGDPALVEHVRIENDTLRLDCEPDGLSNLEIDLTGPAITDWRLLGSAKLALTDIAQRQLRLTISGSGNVTAAGAVETIGLKISGSGNAVLKGLVAKSAEIEISGSGHAQLTAEKDADVSISGSGAVKLFGHPNMSRSNVTGSGRIAQEP
jgi:autotransporter translocation and assembly factor TamB